MAFISNDKEALRLYHMREMAMSDWTSGINNAIKGRTKEIAEKALIKGLSVEDISDLTGLSIDDIKKLQKQN